MKKYISVNKQRLNDFLFNQDINLIQLEFLTDLEFYLNEINNQIQKQYIKIVDSNININAQKKIFIRGETSFTKLQNQFFIYYWLNNRLDIFLSDHLHNCFEFNNLIRQKNSKYIQYIQYILLKFVIKDLLQKQIMCYQPYAKNSTKKLHFLIFIKILKKIIISH